MRFRNVAAVLAALVIAALPLVARAQHGGHGDHERTVRGEILDMACFVGHDAKGPEHAKCALKCLKEGQPMGLLAEDGTIYWLFGDHDDMTAYNQAKDFGGKKVEVRGPAQDKDAIKGITVKAVKPL